MRGISLTSAMRLLIALTLLLPSAASGAPDSSAAWMPEIAIVWPHDLQGRQTSVSRSQLVNVSVWPTSQVSCDGGPNPPIDLFLARNSEPASSIGIAPRLIQRTVGGVRFPSEEFENVPANLAVDPLATYTFVSFVNGIPTGNVWVHAIDSRTFLPHPVVPTGYSGSSPSAVDTRIQIVFPHDERGNFAPVNEATRVNVAVDVFEHGTLNSVPIDFEPRMTEPSQFLTGPLALYVSEDNAPLRAITVVGRQAEVLGEYRVTYTVNGHVFPRWVFNDLPVQPGRQYHFLVIVSGIRTYPSIWTHAADGRTSLAAPATPPPCV